MSHSRSPSFGDDDLQIISSQTLSSTPIEVPDDDGGQAQVIDLSSSPAPRLRTDDAAAATAATAAPTFGRPTQLQSPFVRRKEVNVFNQRTKRPEHHRDLYRITGPLAPKYHTKRAAPAPLFSSMGPSAHPPVSYSQPASSSYADPVVYTDPSKASADLKALLEGGMDDDDDDDKEKEDDREKRDDGTLEGIQVKLLPHQVEGVEWMRGRELGPVKRGKVPKGGILADDMGLGKTLQSISLIVSNPMPRGPDSPGWKKHFEHVARATLVVAPLALIRQWEAEIREKVAPSHALRVCVHHGPGRTKSPRELGAYDVVITTYQILVSEHGKSSPDPGAGPQAGCFGVHWYRVVLDEAHSIKNRNAKATKAACALRAEYRWCLTGTPMQNNLDELQSLVHFLRIQPYDDLLEWRANIDAPMKSGKGHIAIRRLHSLLRCFMKRRTKDILKEEGALVAGGKKALAAAAARADREGRAPDPPQSGFKITERKVVTVAAEFSPAERRFYDNLHARADKSLERMMKGRVNYANALVLLLRLRQACNHPRLAQTRLEDDRDAIATDAAPPQKKAAAAAPADDDLDALADALGGMGIQTKECDMCLNELSRDEVKQGLLRCSACTESLEMLNNDSPSRRKRPAKKGARVSVVTEQIKIEETRRRKPRGRRIVDESDDDEEKEEAEGSWLVPEDQRGALRLGQAGGEEDEDAEGGGEDIGSEDSLHPSEAAEAEDGSQLNSFVVPDDETKASPSDDDDTFVSISKISSQVAGSQTSPGPSPSSSRGRDSSDEDDDDSSEGGDVSAVSEAKPDSDADPDADSDDAPRSAHRRRAARPRGGGGGGGGGGGRKDADGVLISAKMRELISILRREVADHKFIVFSQFTTMLDLLEPFLREQPGFKFVRYDGGMRNDAREAALRALRTDPYTRILLCSLKCGSLGLNLTAATRVVLLEPFWNPFVEEQAIDRVHRLTQTVDVVVYKMTVVGTVEERILELQDKKRRLAEAAIEGGTTRGGGRRGKNALKLGLNEILELFRHDAAGGPPGPVGGNDAAGVGAGGGGSERGSDRAAAVDDVGAMMGRMTLLGKRQEKREEHHVYGRRW